MRTSLLRTFLVILLPTLMMGQKTTYSLLGDTNTSYKSPIESYLNDIPKGKTFNPKMLDLFFAEKIGTSFEGTNDLSLQKYFASLDSKDESFTIGFNFDNRSGDPLKRLRFVYTGGIKFNSKDKFSTIFDEKNFQGSNLGVTLKLTFIGNGTLDFTKKTKNGVTIDRGNAITAFRNLTFENTEKKVQEYNSKTYLEQEKKINVLNNNGFTDQTLNKELKEKYKELYKSIADEEIKFLKENSAYRYMRTYWFSLQTFLPLGEKIYKTTPITADIPTEEKLYAFSSSISGNLIQEWSSGASAFLKVLYSSSYTNNILLDEMNTTSFQTGSLNGDDSITISPAIVAYDTDYDDFINQSLKIEPAIFFCKNTIGFSPSIEYNFGSRYKATNWKLGIPISLKDKDGKPKINFELQWKEVSTLSKVKHMVGITTSFQFGELIN